MPVKNGASYLTECIESIIQQTCKEWELIIVDDHSTDGSVSLITEYAEADSRIHALKNNGTGILSALKKSLDHVKGNMITRMDSDDIMPPYRLEMFKRELTGRKTIVTGRVKYFSNEYSISKGYKSYETWLNDVLINNKAWENIYRECVIASPNWMMFTDELIKIGGFDHLVYPEDYDLVFRWYSEKFLINVIPEITLYWREHSKRTSRNSSNYSQDAFFKLKIRRFLEIDDRKSELILWGRGQKAKLTMQILNDLNRSFTHLTLMDFKKTAHFNNPQVLISVYPSRKERIRIENYLDGLGLIKGKDYWYL